MEIMLAKKLEEMDMGDLIQILTKLKMTNNEAFEDLKEIIEDL
jgi:TusA-related sulfurtransferase